MKRRMFIAAIIMLCFLIPACSNNKYKTFDEKKIEKIIYPQVSGNNECKDKKQIKEIVNYYNNLKLEKIEEEDMDYNPTELVGDSSQSEIHYNNGDIEEIIIYEKYVMIINDGECIFYKKNSE